MYVLYYDIPVSSADVTVYISSRWDSLSLYHYEKDFASNLDMIIFIISIILYDGAFLTPFPISKMIYLQNIRIQVKT